MKVYNFCCEHEHRFEGWFSSEDDFILQSAALQIECPVCNSSSIKRLPSAPRLNLAGDQASLRDGNEQSRSQWIEMARQVIANTEDVGDRFPEEARRIHYRETPAHGIRGVATRDERDALVEEGIDVLPFPIPSALKQTLQ
jgi:hypothetical protein